MPEEETIAVNAPNAAETLHHEATAINDQVETTIILGPGETVKIKANRMGKTKASLMEVIKVVPLATISIVPEETANNVPEGITIMAAHKSRTIPSPAIPTLMRHNVVM